MDWERLSTLMIRQMIRQFVDHPGEFLTFQRLAWLISDADPDVLHAIAEHRPDLFVVTKNDRSLKLFPEAVERIVRMGVEQVLTEEVPVAYVVPPQHDSGGCAHFSDEEILVDLRRCSLPAEALTRNCCWTKICHVRGLNKQQFDQDSWDEICRIRGYLLRRQNPRGF